MSGAPSEASAPVSPSVLNSPPPPPPHLVPPVVVSSPASSTPSTPSKKASTSLSPSHPRRLQAPSARNDDVDVSAFPPSPIISPPLAPSTILPPLAPLPPPASLVVLTPSATSAFSPISSPSRPPHPPPPPPPPPLPSWPLPASRKYEKQAKQERYSSSVDLPDPDRVDSLSGTELFPMESLVTIAPFLPAPFSSSPHIAVPTTTTASISSSRDSTTLVLAVPSMPPTSISEGGASGSSTSLVRRFPTDSSLIKPASSSSCSGSSSSSACSSGSNLAKHRSKPAKRTTTFAAAPTTATIQSGPSSDGGGGVPGTTSTAAPAMPSSVPRTTTSSSTSSSTEDVVEQSKQWKRRKYRYRLPDLPLYDFNADLNMANSTYKNDKVLKRCVRLRVSMVMGFLFPMIVVVLAFAFPVWYISYTGQIANVSGLFGEVRQRLVNATATTVDHIFIDAERDLVFMTEALTSSAATLNLFCSSNQTWTDKERHILTMHVIGPVFPNFHELRISLATPSETGYGETQNEHQLVLRNREELVLTRHNLTHHIRMTRVDEFLEMWFVDSNVLALDYPEMIGRFKLVSYPTGSVKGERVIWPIPINQVFRLSQDPMWEDQPMILPTGAATLSLFANLICPDQQSVVHVRASLITNDFSLVVREAVESGTQQRMFLTFQRVEGWLLGASHGKICSDTDSPKPPDDTSVTWFSPSQSDDAIIANVGAVLFDRFRTWNVTDVDLEVRALDQDWLVLSNAVSCPGLSFQLWLLQDSESLYGDVRNSKKFAIVVFVIFFGSSIGVAVVIAYLLVRPLLKLQKSMTHISRAEFLELAQETSLNFSRLREVYTLQLSYHQMLMTLDSFARFVPHPLIGEILVSGITPQLVVLPKYVGVFFLDICDFTQISLTFSTECIALMLFAVFERISAIVSKNNGTIDKYIGDCVMAVWGAVGVLPDLELHACRAVCQCVHTMRHDLRSSLLRQGLPGARFRIGLHAGTACVGNIGCGFRFNFTAVGDTVNVASRLEAANRLYGTAAIISETVAVKVQSSIPMICLGPIHLIGRDERLRIYEVLDRFVQDEAGICPDVVARWNTAVELYKNRSFAEAMAGFDRLTLHTEAAAYFYDQCRYYQLQGPAEDWDGSELQKYK